MFQQNNPGVYTAIYYHMSWPGTDPYYNYNAADGNTRRSYYGLNWVPYMVIDGENDEGSTNTWQTHILNNGATTSPLEISIAGSFDYQTGSGNCVVSLTTETGTSGTYSLQVVLVEDDLYYMGANGYPDHQNVMRDMFPSSSGTTVTLEAGVETIEEVAFHIPSELVVENCRLVVFVQSSNHDILNSISVDVAEITPLNIPFLTVMSTDLNILNDDGDEKLNPGESADFTITVENACDWVNALDVMGYLSSNSPYVTISDSIGSYDMIVSCDFISNLSDQYSFSVSDAAPSVTDLEFSLRLTANLDTEAPYEIIIPVTITMDLFQNNFPVGLTQPIVSGNAAVDLDGDGILEVIVGGSDSLLHVYTLSGEELSGFPFPVQNKIVGAPAVGDVDNDGDLEIVITSRDKHIYVIQHDGSGEAIVEAASYLLGTPALDDLDGDGDMEIIVGGFGYDLLVVHHDGSALPGFPLSISGERMSCGVSIADLDGDGSKDIIVGTWGDNIHAFDLNGSSLAGFPVPLGDNVAAPPVVADLDFDGNPEVLVGQDDGIFYAISNTGSILWTQQVSSSTIRNSAAVTDFNNDGYLEIVFASNDGFVTVLDYTGNEMAGWPQSVGATCYSSPVIADLDGDEIPEIVIGSDSGELFAFHVDGSPVPNFPVSLSSTARGTPSVDDLDQDGNLELIIGTDKDLTLIDLKFPAIGGYSWYTARGNYQRTGYFNTPVLSSGQETVIPRSLQLDQNYPNPFNPSTMIRFGIPTSSLVTLTIYDILGQEVSSFINTELAPGSYSLLWNGLDANKNPIGTGIYFARIRAAGSEQVIKMMFIK